MTVCGESTTSGQSRVTSSGSAKPSPRVHQGEEVVSGLLLGEQVRKGSLVFGGKKTAQIW